LDLAQYRELAAFAQFGSDLDKATQAQLDRGVRLVELLKQPQYKPMSLGQEIVVLFAGTRGFIDKYDVEKVRVYEEQLLSFVETKHADILKEIEDKKIISPELEKKMKEVLTNFDSVFVA
ncbi:MAG: F0F1 ATP synthase subunit alpha, partial [Smithella sp.]